MRKKSPAKPTAADLETLTALLAKFPGIIEAARPVDPRDARTVKEVIGLYLDDAKSAVTADHYAHSGATLNLFAEKFGTRTIGECIPHDLKSWIAAHDAWASGWTRQRINACVQRAFNWAHSMRLIRENPFKGTHQEAGDARRPMTEEEYRALLRASHADFRRMLLFLRLSGARPAEMRAMRWSDVDWERRVVVLKKHKTSAKTRKPRLIVMVPALIKLLTWIQQHQSVDCTADWLGKLLANGPVKAGEVNRLAKKKKISYRMLQRARARIGARPCRVGGYAGNGCTVYKIVPPTSAPDPAVDAMRAILRNGPMLATEVNARMREKGFNRDQAHAALEAVGIRKIVPGPRGKLPTVYELSATSQDREGHVFLNAYGQPWTRAALCRRMKRMRKKAGLKVGCSAYGLRHLFAVNGAKLGLNIKTLANLMGHTQISTTAHYLSYLGDDLDHLHESSGRIAVGSSARLSNGVH
jgi:integrase